MLVLILIGMSAYMIGADPIVNAVYTPESHITLEVAVGPFTSSTVLGAKLGTFSLTSSTGEIYSPSLVGINEASGAISVTGLMKDYANESFDSIDETRSQDFYILSAAYPNGFPGTPVLKVLYNNVIPLISWGPDTVTASTASPFVVELYLVNHNKTSTNAIGGYRPASYFSLGTPYALPLNFNPHFSIATANNSTTNVGTYTGSGIINSQGSYAANGNNDGPDNTPIIGPGAYTNPEDPTAPGFFYGDDPNPPPPKPLYLLQIINEREINLYDAYGVNTTRVAKAKIEIINAETGTDYKIQIKFDSSSVSQGSFQLHLDGNHNLYGIPYSLYFKQQEVIPGNLMTWKHLKSDPSSNHNTKPIKVTGVAQIIAEAAPSGTYSDTITVTIIPVDTV